jgi:serine/threonine protein phosphatase PrpC
MVNMRVTANSVQGHRKYMEDCYKIRFHRDKSAAASTSSSDILFSYFGMFDGHGGKEASQYCKERLYWCIVEQVGTLSFQALLAEPCTHLFCVSHIRIHTVPKTVLLMA